MAIAALSRRAFLRHAPVAAAATALPVAAAAADPEMTPEERRDYHLAEFKKACTDVEPALCEWIVNLSSDGNVLIFGRVPTGEYLGDGLYEGATLTAFGKRIQYQVKQLRYRLDDERVFEVRCPGDVMHLPESRFRTFIGRKLSA